MSKEVGVGKKFSVNETCITKVFPPKDLHLDALECYLDGCPPALVYKTIPNRKKKVVEIARLNKYSIINIFPSRKPRRGEGNYYEINLEEIGTRDA